MPKNLNTPSFWDREFSKEYKIFINDENEFYRWVGLRFLIISSAIGNKGRLLDVGCGLGHFCRYIKAKYPKLKVSGTDISAKAIKFAKEIDRRGDYFLSEPNRIDSNKKYDWIVLSEVIEHTTKPEKLVEVCRERLTPEGTLIITTPIWSKEGLISKEHIKEYKIEELATLLETYFKKAKIILPPHLVDPKAGLIQYAEWQMGIGKNGEKDILLKKTYPY